MERDLSKFVGRLPYASELYGVHQPLLGWRSRLGGKRIAGVLRLPSFPRNLLVDDPGRRPFFMFTPTRDREKGVHVDGNGEIFALHAEGIDVFATDPAFIRFDTPEHLDGLLVRSLQAEAKPMLADHPRDDAATWGPFWQSALDKDRLNRRLANALEELKGHEFALGSSAAVAGKPLHAYVAGIFARIGDVTATFDYVLNRELVVARYLNGLLPAGDAGEVAAATARLNDLVLKVPQALGLEAALKALDPLALTTGATREGVLTPIGILHVFRQFFFEFDNFLGPAVEHLWLAPGATTELIEVSTRRVLVEETLERSLERVLTNEAAATTEDELSIALRTETERDTKHGASVEAGATVLVAHGEATASMSIEETQRVAREDNHRTKRQQSTKLASEIRSNVKSTFRTVTETTDTRSRRYVIENKVGPDGGAPVLVNYELRRKMRQVGVQTQDVGTQLCWQVFVDDPGQELGVGQFVHLAAKSDLSKYAEQPQKRLPSRVTETITILLPVPKPGERSSLGPIAASGFLGLMANGVPGVAAGVAVYEVLDSLFGDDEEEREIYGITPERILRQEYRVTLPPGYVIAPAADQDTTDGLFTLGNAVAGDVPLRHLSNGAGLKFRAQIASPAEGRVLMVVDGGEVTAGELLEFQIRIAIEPTGETVQAVRDENVQIAKDNAARTVERDRKIKEDFINNVRERVKLASQVKARPAADLREEERTVVYRALVSQLMRDAWSVTADRKVAHLRSEFIKSIFDVDRMFYAVAPEWWQPRRRVGGQQAGAAMPRAVDGPSLSTTSQSAIQRSTATEATLSHRAKRAQLGTLGNDDVVGWGGGGRADNYLITEESNPARLGASLGWLLQLDGDNLRSAFLNAPWVKAVIPIRPGRERDALEWLQQGEVEGQSGLDEVYAGADADVFRARLAALGEDRDPTIREVLLMVADEVAAKHRAAVTPVEGKRTVDGAQKVVRYLPPERVFEFGFDPLEDGFRAVAKDGEMFGLVDQWVEILPTDQIAAVRVDYDPKTGRML